MVCLLENQTYSYVDTKYFLILKIIEENEINTLASGVPPELILLSSQKRQYVLTFILAFAELCIQ